MKQQRKLTLALRQSAALAATLAVLGAIGVAGNARAEFLLHGVDETMEANIRALSPLASAECTSARWRIERLFRDSEPDVRRALEALGYYSVQMRKEIRWPDECFVAEYWIEPGSPVILDVVDIDVTGAASDDPQYASRLPGDRPATGDTLNHGTYNNYKQSMLRAANYAGYFDADFARNEIIIQPDRFSADIHLQLQSGAKYSFERVTFTPGILDDSLLARYADIDSGDPYSSKAINDLYAALSGSSYFESVSIDTSSRDPNAKTVDIDVSLTPAKRKLYSVGGGFTTDTGVNGRLGYTDRRINTRGHQGEAKLFASAVRTELNGTYRWPKRDPRREWLSLTAGAQFEDTETSRHDTYKLGIRRTKAFGGGWIGARYLNLEREDFRVADQSDSSSLLILGFNWEKSRGRSLTRTESGYYISADIRGSSESLASDTDFLQLRANAKLIRSLSPRTRLLTRVSLGATAKASLTELPASVRFFSGGDRSVRGYDFETLGPVNADGEVIGGSHQLDASLELDYEFREGWTVAVFADAGSAFNDTDFDVSRGVGLGFRWYSPIGPIRIDFASPLDDDDNDFRLHIGLGPDL